MKNTKKTIVIGIFIIFIGASLFSTISGSVTLGNENSLLKTNKITTLSEAKSVANSKLVQMEKIDFFIENHETIYNGKNKVLFYVFDLKPQGYIVVSANRLISPVLAYSFTSEFGEIDFSTNPLLSMLKIDIEYRLNNIENLPYEIIQNRNDQWTELLNYNFQGREFQQWPPEGSTSTGGWVETRWTQNAPYNNFCPIDLGSGQRSVAGCPAVAMAQILNYHETTKDVQFNDDDDYYHSYAGNYFWVDDDYITYDFPSWPQLNAYLDTLNYHWDEEIPLTNNDKAAINVACGFAMRQVYNPGGSGTFGVSQAYDAYQRFDFEESELLLSSNPELYERLSSNIKNALPAHIAVVDPAWQVGHNMVVDGYNTDDFYHINFGWGGPYDGWYIIPDDLPYELTVIEGLIVDILNNVHFLNLENFPWYLSQVDSGAMVMKMMLDFLMWNSSTHPTGPPDVYNEQTLYDSYSGGNWINGTEICSGLNLEIDDQHQTPPWSYGYFFAPYSNTSSDPVLRRICTWLDYPVDWYNDYRQVPVPKPGHTNHVPVAVPLDGDYDHWVTIRGIHTDHDAWNYTGPLTIFGFWINDPVFAGIGENTYVTVEQFLSTYYSTLNVPGDTHNGKYLAITDPYIDCDIPIANDIEYAKPVSQFTTQEANIVNQKNPSLYFLADNIVTKTAYDQALNILKYDDIYAEIFTDAQLINSPVYTKNNCKVTFKNQDVRFNILINSLTGVLLELSIQ